MGPLSSYRAAGLAAAAGLGLGGVLARSTVGEGSARPRPARALGPEAPGNRGSLPAWARPGPALPAHAVRHPRRLGFCASRGQRAPSLLLLPAAGMASLWIQRGILACLRWWRPGSGKGNAGILLLWKRGTSSSDGGESRILPNFGRTWYPRGCLWGGKEIKPSCRCDKIVG